MGCKAPCMSWRITVLLLTCAPAAICLGEHETPLPKSASTRNDLHVDAFVGDYCLDCHDSATKTADLSLEAISSARIEGNSEIWERVVRRLRARQMPPPDAARP